MNLKDIQYKHLNWKAKKLIRVAGYGTLHEYNGSVCIIIVPAKFSFNFYRGALGIFMMQFLIAAVRANTAYEFLVRIAIALVFVLVGILLIKLWRDYVH